MNLTVLLIAAYLPLLAVVFMILRSGSFGRGSIGTLLKLFFLGVASAVPAFLMEAGGLLIMNILLGLFRDDAFGGNLPVISAVMRYLVIVALIEEGWKHFVLRTSTWRQMTMETIEDGIAASAVVGAGFSAVMYGAWQAALYVVPDNMAVIRYAMPDFLHAGAVTSFIFALLYIFSHFGFSGLMGAFYGIAKHSEQKDHGRRAGFMLVISCLLPVLVHGLCASLVGYGIVQEKLLWYVIGTALEVLLAVMMAAMLSRASDRVGEYAEDGYDDGPVDFADSQEFADFAEASGREESSGDRPASFAEGRPESLPDSGSGEYDDLPDSGSFDSSSFKPLMNAGGALAGSLDSPGDALTDMESAGFSQAAGLLDDGDDGSDDGQDDED